MWVKIKPPGIGRRCSSLVPFTRVPFGVRIFDPQPPHSLTGKQKQTAVVGSGFKQNLARSTWGASPKVRAPVDALNIASGEQGKPCKFPWLVFGLLALQYLGHPPSRPLHAAFSTSSLQPATKVSPALTPMLRARALNVSRWLFALKYLSGCLFCCEKSRSCDLFGAPYPPTN